MRAIRPHPSRSAAVLLLVLVGIGLGLAVYRAAAHAEFLRARTRFDRIAERRADGLQEKFNEAKRTVEAAAAVVATFPALTYREFVAFAHHLETEHANLKALEWAPRVVGSDRERLEAEARRQGFEQYRIVEITPSGGLAPAGDRAAYYPVLFVQPLAGNESAVGLDLGSEKTRRSALLLAAETGRSVASGPIHLVQETGTSPSFLMVVPVFRNPSSPRDGAALRGFVIGVFRIEDLLAASMRDAQGDWPYVSLELLDEPAESGLTAYYAAPTFARATSRGWTVAREVELAEHRLRLLARPGSAYIAGERTRQPLALGVVTVFSFATLVGFVAFVRRWSREKSRRQETALVRSVIRSIPDGVVVADMDGRLVVANDAARVLAGVTRRDVPPEQWSEAFGLHLPGTDRLFPADQLPLARAIRGEEVRGVELVVSGRDASAERYLNVSGAPLKDHRGHVQGGVTVFQDITERKQAEALSRQLSNAVEQTADSVVITDGDGIIVYVNRAFEETTGFSRDEALGRTPRILNSGHHGKEFYENLWKQILSDRPFRGTILNRKKSGETYWAEQTISPVKEHNGAITHFVSVLKDVTDLLERQKQEFHLQLAREVQQRYYNVQAALPGFDIAGAAHPQDLTGGDYFDFIPQPPNSLYLATGDVAGHGFGSALLMAQLRASVRSAIASDLQPEEVLARVNRTLHPDVGENRFAMLMLARLDASGRTLECAGAGYIPCYLLDPDGTTRAAHAGTGLPLGIQLDATFPPSTPIPLKSGQILVLLTDGITEAPNEAEEEFGEQRALEYVVAHREESAEKILNGLFEAVRHFCDYRPQVDDITGVICKVL